MPASSSKMQEVAERFATSLQEWSVVPSSSENSSGLSQLFLVRVLLTVDKMGQAVSLFEETISEWSSDRASRLAAALAFYSTFFIVPRIAGLLLGLDSAPTQVYARRFGSHTLPVANLIGDQES